MCLSLLNTARDQLIKIKQQHFLNLVTFFETKQEEIKDIPDNNEKQAILLLLEGVRTEYKRVQKEEKAMFAEMTRLSLVKK